MREELHERLEEMVCEVNDAINDRPSPETQKTNLEMDEMYDCLKRTTLAIIPGESTNSPSDFGKSSNHSSISTS